MTSMKFLHISSQAVKHFKVNNNIPLIRAETNTFHNFSV